ncbi:helix-turn-helix transcriptional regulator [Candidatus Saccharibacteria bacterium]|nr:helix-turn-helix transcriptional regulator [Candidatus Saccharibacteria bacterium]
MNFKHNLRKQRSAAGLSQEKLAEKMSVSRQTISKWENGSVYPSTSHIFSLARILNCSASELMDDEPNKKISQDTPSIASYYRTAFHKKIAYWLVGVTITLFLMISSLSLLSLKPQTTALNNSKIVVFDKLIDGSLDNFLITDGYLKRKFSATD